MNTLRVYFSGSWQDSTTPCPWALCDDAGNLLQSGTDPLAALPDRHPCIAIVAAERVLCTAAPLPPGPRRRWSTALPFIVEAQTLPEPDDNHVVPGPVLEDGRIMLAVADKAWIRNIIHACRTANLRLRRIIPEIFMTPPVPGQWLMILDSQSSRFQFESDTRRQQASDADSTGSTARNERGSQHSSTDQTGLGSGFVRTGPASGMALDNCDAAAVPVALRLLLDSARGALPGKIEVRMRRVDGPTSNPLPDWGGLPVPLVAGPPWDWRTAPIAGDAINLLWGTLAPRTGFREGWPSLRPAVWIALVALAIEITGTHIEWAMLANEKRQLNAEMARTFHATFGSNSALVNAPLQMQRNLAALRHGAGLPDDSDFLPLLDVAAPHLASLPAGSVHEIHYAAGQLDVDLKLERSTDFRSLQQRLQSAGMNVRLGNMQEHGRHVEARVTLQPGGAT